MFKLISLLILILCLVFSNAYGLKISKTSYQYEGSLDSLFVIGVMPRVDLQDVPGTEICGQWYRGDQIATVPNGDWFQGSYCRTTDVNGNTFFVYRDRFSVRYPIETWTVDVIDLSGRNIRFKVISPVSQFIDVQMSSGY